MSVLSDPDVDRFRHPAFFYDSPAAYVDGLVPSIIDALDRRHGVLIAVPGPNLAALRAALGASAGAVTLIDMTEVGRNPGGILAGVLVRFVEASAPHPVLMIGEPLWDGRTALEYPACVQYEALINLAFTGRDVTVICPYDAHLLPATHLDDACTTHPVLWRHGEPETGNAQFAPDDAWLRYNEPLHAAADAVGCTVRTFAELHRARAFAARYGQWFGCDGDQLVDLRLIVTELATDALVHRAGPCRLTFWAVDGYLACEARDRARVDDPLAGPHGAHQVPGGLMVVHAVADLVRCHAGPEGTTIHAYLRVEESD